MIIASVIIGISLIVAAIVVSSGFVTLANVMSDSVAHEIHVHAETMNEIKHQGIGIDNKETK